MTWLTWIPRWIAFWAWYAAQLLLSNAAVIRDTLTPGQHSTPGIAVVQTLCRTELEVSLLGALITLTPGTLTMGAHRSESAWSLVVHGMYADDAAALHTEVREMEGRLLSAMRRTGVPA